MAERALPPLNEAERRGRQQRPVSRLAPLATVAVGLLVIAPLALAWLPYDGPGSLPVTPVRIAWSALAASLGVAAASAAICVLVGGLLAAAVVLTDLPGRQFWATAGVLPFVCPATVWTLAQVYCYGPGGLVHRWLPESWQLLARATDGHGWLTTTLVLAQIHAPLALVLLGRGLLRLQTAGADAARLFLGPWALARWTARSLRLEALAAFLLAFALALGNFAVPHVLQCHLYSIEIYARMTNYFDPQGALQIALPALAATVLTASLLGAVDRGGYASASPSPAFTPLRLGRGRWGLAGVVGLYVTVALLVPLGAMIAECGSIAHFLSAAADAAPETENTLLIAGAAGLMALVMGIVAGKGAACRSPFVHAILILPLALPAIFLGLGYLRCFSRPWPAALSAMGGTTLLVVIGLAGRAWPLATRIIGAGHRRIAPEWLGATDVAQSGRFRRWRWITLPLLGEHLAAAAVIAVIVALGDVEISQTLCPPGSGTLALRLMTFLHFGPAHVTAGLALLQMLLAVMPLLAYFLVTNRCPPLL